MKKIREIVRLRLSCVAGVRQIAAACKIGTATGSEFAAKIESAVLSWPSAGAHGLAAYSSSPRSRLQYYRCEICGAISS